MFIQHILYTVPNVNFPKEATSNFYQPCHGHGAYIFAAWLAQLVERQFAVREVDGSSPRPDQHSGS